MPVEPHVAMKTDSRQVVPGDYLFFMGVEDLRRLDTHNLRVDAYGLCPKVFSRLQDAVAYIQEHSRIVKVGKEYMQEYVYD